MSDPVQPSRHVGQAINVQQALKQKLNDQIIFSGKPDLGHFASKHMGIKNNRYLLSTALSEHRMQLRFILKNNTP